VNGRYVCHDSLQGNAMSVATQDDDLLETPPMTAYIRRPTRFQATTQVAQTEIVRLDKSKLMTDPVSLQAAA
jgi:hypothetical protein